LLFLDQLVEHAHSQDWLDGAGNAILDYSSEDGAELFLVLGELLSEGI